MTDYDMEEQMAGVAYVCRYFSMGRLPGGRPFRHAADISCGSCKSWDGSRCSRNVFHNILTEIE